MNKKDNTRHKEVNGLDLIWEFHQVWKNSVSVSKHVQQRKKGMEFKRRKGKKVYTVKYEDDRLEFLTTQTSN